MTDDLWRNSLLANLLADPAAPKKPEGLLGLGALSAGLLSEASPPPLTGLMSLGAQELARINALSGNLYDRAFRDIPMKPGAMTGNVFASGSPYLPTLAPAPPRPAPRRHVFFSFHFQADIHRVNIVRNSWRIRPEDHVPGFFDRSLWERKKRTDIGALKRMIRVGLKGTSVTCVLAGECTWARPWVRYEIAESVAQGNGLLTVDIDELRCLRTRSPCDMGLNPLDHIGVYWAKDGRAYVCELTERGWVQYDRLTDPVTWPSYMPDRGTVNDAHPLSLGTSRYAYRSEGGYTNLTRWVREAAQAARRR
jgi:hypothetical protein